MRDALSEVFGALADDTRRGLYEQLLASHAGLTATELASSSSVSRQAIVKHLQVLERAGLASPERDGREVRYLATTRGTEPVSSWLIAHAEAWDRRIATLEKNVRDAKRT